MKYSNVGLIFFLFLYFIPLSRADSSKSSASNSAIPANGKVVRFDLNGDGRKESISLISKGQAKDGRTSTYRLKVNNVVLNGVWTESDIEHNVEVDGLSICDLNRKDSSKEIVIFGPYGYEWSACKIYAWRGGQIRPVLGEPMMVERFKGDGTVTELANYNWGVAHFSYRLNRQHQLKRVPHKTYPLLQLGSADSKENSATPIEKTVRFHTRPHSQSPTLIVKQGEKLVFDRITSDNWVGARYKQRILWMSLNQIEQLNGKNFSLVGAG